MQRNTYQKLIEKAYSGTKQIAYNPELAKALGSVKAGLLLNQLLFWHGKGRDPEWTYKTIKEMEKETGLSRAEQATAIRICKRYEILEVKRKGIPAKRHFRININKIVELMRKSIYKN